MPKVRSILGHVSVETAKAKRGCSRHKTGRAAHPITKGETCLVVTDANGKHNYCHESAVEILDLAASDVTTLRSALGV